MTIQFSEEKMNKVREVIARYPQKRSALLPLLHADLGAGRAEDQLPLWIA